MVRIVIMDQDAPIRHLVQKVLEEAGYRVVEAHNSYEGWQRDPAALPSGTRSDLVYLVAF
jgi:DNA-binding response OmpR family regulator